MNKAKMSTKKWRITSLQQVADQATKSACVPVAVQNPSGPVTEKKASGSSYGIDVRQMVEDAAIIRAQKANAEKTNELSETKTIKPTGLFNKRTKGR